MKTNRTFVTLATLLSFVGVARAKDPGEMKGPYHPTIDRSAFSSIVNNPYFPLVPGTIKVFSEQDEGDTLVRTVTVTHDTKMVMGVKCVVVHDVVSEEGKVEEDTYDWFAQDKEGTVWYFGEVTKEFQSHGRVSTEGSWEAGVNGQPGIVMPAHPVPGPAFREEYSPDNAEDMGQVVAVGVSMTVPFGSFTGCVQTKDWSLLEVGTEKKWYAKGIGMIRAESTGGEAVTLVSIKHE